MTRPRHAWSHASVRRLTPLLAASAVAVGVTSCGGDGGAAAAGDELFQNNCAACHGPDGTGTASGPPLVHELYVPQETSDDDILVAVQNGASEREWDFGPMPPLSGLSDAEVAAITEYLRDLQRDAGLID